MGKKKQSSGALGLVEAAKKAASTNAMKDAAGTLKLLANASDNWRWVDFCDPVTGLPVIAIEYLFGTRGLLCGRLYHSEAEESVGKSSTVYFLSGAGQRASNALPIVMESERALPTADFIARFGCDPNDTLVAQPKAIGVALTQLTTLVNLARNSEDRKDLHDRPIIASLDSVSGLAPDDTADDDEFQSEGGSKGYHSRILGKFFRDKGQWLEDNDVVLLTTGQSRADFKEGFGKKGQPSGGSGEKDKTSIGRTPLKFHATAMVTLTQSPLWEEVEGKNTNIGILVRMRVTKNKLNDAYRSVPPIRLVRKKGFDFTTQSYEFLKEHSPFRDVNGNVFLNLDMRGSWLNCEQYEWKSQGQEKALQLTRKILADEPMMMKVREALQIRGFGFDFERKFSFREDQNPMTDVPEEEQPVE